MRPREARMAFARANMRSLSMPRSNLSASLALLKSGYRSSSGPEHACSRKNSASRGAISAATWSALVSPSSPLSGMWIRSGFRELALISASVITPPRFKPLLVPAGAPARVLDGRHQCVEVPGAVVAQAVNEKCRRAVNPAPRPAQKVFAYPVEIPAFSHFTNELRNIKTDQGGVFHQILILERLLIFEEEIVHLPELALRPGRLRLRRGAFGVRVDGGQWKVAKDEPHQITGAHFELFHHVIGLAAIRALIVAVFHQGDGRRELPSDVVALLANLNGELWSDHSCLCHASASRFESSASRASRTPSAPGLTSSGER